MRYSSRSPAGLGREPEQEGPMRMRAYLFIPLIGLLCLASVVGAEEASYVEMFSPQGTVKGVRQVSVRFSGQMVPYGDPRLESPFEVQCPEEGRARWADGRNWVYGFERDLPAGVACTFTLKPGLTSLAGVPVGGQRSFSFSTGGPAILQAHPGEGSESIDENQIFLLSLDAAATEESVLAHAFCSIEGIKERVGVRLITGEERDRLLRMSAVGDDGRPRIALQCRQSFPNTARVSLVWGRGISSPGGMSTAEDQVLHFKTRPPFTATFRCGKENPHSGCIPLLPMELRFSAPVPAELAAAIVLKGPKGAIHKASPLGEEGAEGEKDGFVYRVVFKGPFPERAAFTLEVPKNLRDDAGRPLANADRFPLSVATDAYPPLAKFSARFGIIELKGEPLLPVTLRNLEREIRTRTLKVGEEDGSLRDKGRQMMDGLKGRMHKVSSDREEKIISWLKEVGKAGRRRSVLQGVQGAGEFRLPKPGGAKAFEVIGIPLKEPGFYVVEMESRILGSSLLGEQRPMYVPTAALVTNLSAHFKRGRESSLVWVTTLDRAEPVKDAEITLRDCKGNAVWTGRTDSDGVARIKTSLPPEDKLPHCASRSDEEAYYDYPQMGALSGIHRGLFVFAKAGNDITFTHSSWDRGIEPWRYGLPGPSFRGPVIVHTVFDRTLLRSGETAHMKHLIRKRTMSGFSLVSGPELPKAVLLRHQGSGQQYELPLSWKKDGSAETAWTIPAGAKLGRYEVFLLKEPSGKRVRQGTAMGGDAEGDEGAFPENEPLNGWPSGGFRVEEFRVPLMKGSIQPPKEPLVNAAGAELDLMVSYLSGGGASHAPVIVRGQVQPRYVHFDEYEGFLFANGEVREGITVQPPYLEGEPIQEPQEDQASGEAGKKSVRSARITLDKAGSARATLSPLPSVSASHDLLAELEFRDPAGEVQTVSARIPLWPSKVLVGIKPESWAASGERFRFRTVVLDLSGKPVPNAPVTVELFQRKNYSHRKRTVGGFYSYEHVTEVKRIGRVCEGKTDAKGLLFCQAHSPVSGEVLLQATAADEAGNRSLAHREVWIAGKGEWWFDVSDSDRIDLLPERKKYEPGETAKFQVRMPFREATALITVEREGVVASFVRRISGKNPVVELPVKASYAPNVFVSVLCVRGRVGGVQPAAAVDLGKPAFKLGIAEIKVGGKPFQLKVGVSTDRREYRVREKVPVRIQVGRGNGAPPPKGTEVIVAAVDEGLLELMPNGSWNLFEAMMGRRGHEVRTATAQMQVVGKRHYGLKALPQGGGGGKQTTRELFDTLLFWKACVPLDDRGEAVVEIPLNDSLSGFRIVAVAHGGADLFGTGQTSVRTTQDLMILPGLPPLVREGDRFRAGFTVRNASHRRMDTEISISVPGVSGPGAVRETLDPGETKEVGWEVQVPQGVDSLSWEAAVRERGGAGEDRVALRQKVVAAVPVRTFQSTILQIDTPLLMEMERPGDALPGKGGVRVSFSPKLAAGLDGVVHFMKKYPYTCMEQKVSRAVALRDGELWKRIMGELPSHLDRDGLVKYFPSVALGSDVLTTYLLAVSDEAGWKIPDALRERMEEGLRGFVTGKVARYSALPTADLFLRKMAAVEALSRRGAAEPKLLDSIAVEPNLWPTSGVTDWTNVLLRMKDIPRREQRLAEAMQILRSRLTFQGSVMGFSTGRRDDLWWLMVSEDVNAVRTLLTFLDLEGMKEDIPRLVRGALGRQHKGAWDTTVANAWGMLAMEKFSEKFESVPVTGISSATVKDKTKEVRWDGQSDGGSAHFGWSGEREKLHIGHKGSGKPWTLVQSLAAVPLQKPFFSGYTVRKTLIPVERKLKDAWSRGDVVRVRLELEAQSDMTWVVVDDPIPAGASLLGTGLGRDSELLSGGEGRAGWVWPAFEERSFEAFRAYYEMVPKGKWMVEYTMRLNNPGTFSLPETKVEALYAPEMRGEIPNGKMEIRP